MMENLYKFYRKRIDSEKSSYLRYQHNDIDWDERMIGIIGPVPPDIPSYSDVQMIGPVAGICNPSFCILRICNPLISLCQTITTSSNPFFPTQSIAELYL